MAETLGQLDKWADAVLGQFTWGNGVWNGSCEFNGHTVRLQLDTDNTNPSREEQLAVFEPSRAILGRLREVEPEFRRRAAKQIAAAVVSQQSRHARVTLPIDRFADGMELQSVSIHTCGELNYRSPEFFPGWVVTIYFNEGVSFGDAEVYEAVR